MLLSGLKTGKKKRNKDPPSAPKDNHGEKREGKLETGAFSNQESETKAPSSSAVTNRNTLCSNLSVAEQLRAQLAGGGALSLTVKDNADGARRYQNLEQRGRIHGVLSYEPKASSSSQEQVVVMNLPRTGGGGVTLHSTAANSFNDPSIADMLKEEKASSMSLAELEARTAMRTGKKRRIKQKRLDNMDSDEEEDMMLQQQKQVFDTTSEKSIRRDTSRAVAKNDQQDRIVSKCWWWMESSQFERKRLIALGNHVSLSLAPLNQSLIKGQHFYLVPLVHVESLAGAEMEVWDELVRFQTSLRVLFEKQNKGVVFFETVLPSQSFWQTRLECVAIPREQWMDAPLFIRQALLEQAQEDGTHQKLMTTSAVKGLRAVVPKNFSYIYFEYDQQQGYVQMIETRDFPKDFAVDTIAGMIQDDPMRFRRKEKISPEEERSTVMHFLDSWKPVDWTLQLD